MVIELLTLGENFCVVEKPRCGPWTCPALLRWSSEKGERVRVLIIPASAAATLSNQSMVSSRCCCEQFSLSGGDAPCALLYLQPR